MSGINSIHLVNENAVKSSMIVIAIMLLSSCFNSNDNDNDNDKSSFKYRAALQTFSSCNELTDYIQQTVEQEDRLSDYFYSTIKNIDTELTPMESGAVTANSDSAGSATAADTAIDSFTATNNQVKGVDEADFVKTSGDYTYVLNGGHLVIFDSWPAAQTNELSRIRLKGSPLAIFIYEDIAWVVSRLSDYSLEAPSFSIQPRTQVLTRVSVFDISNRKAPILQRKITFEGDYVNARRMGPKVYMVTSAHMNYFKALDTEDGFDIEALLPVFTDQIFSEENAEEHVEPISSCNTIYHPETANGTGTVSVISFDLEQPQGEIQRQTILTNTGLVYANHDNLYIASTEDRYWAWLPVLEGFDNPEPGTTLHKFSLGDRLAYLASGRVEGYLINQFAMDEDKEMLRVVTSTNSWWNDEVPKNSLYILQQKGDKLEQRSVLNGLGKPGDRIYAVRFQGDQGFVVTFRNIDPLYTLDLSDADNPRIAGELEVPGFSTYLHPIEPGLLLAVGRSVTANSINLSLFDTSDFSNPTLLHKKTIGKGTYSNAEYDHKAFTWDPRLEMLALPVTRWGSNLLPTNYQDHNDFNGLQLYQVNRESGFTLFGEVDHSELYVNEKSQYAYFPQALQRSFFITDTEQNSFLYSISQRGLKVSSVSDVLNNVAVLPLPTYDWDTILYID